MSRSTTLFEHDLSNLITLFYGLALATGLEHTMPDFFAGNYCVKQGGGVLILVALIVGLSDWFVYHFYAAKERYESIPRLSMDVAFPILIFALFVCSNRPMLLYGLIALYCLLALTYLATLRQLKPRDRFRLQVMYVLALAIIVASAALSYAINLCAIEPPIYIYGVAASVLALWLLVTVPLIKRALKTPTARFPARASMGWPRPWSCSQWDGHSL